MAKMNGCNADHMTKVSGPQGKGRMNPSSFDRNNMSKGGVNNYLGGTKSKYSQPVGKGKAHDGR